MSDSNTVERLPGARLKLRERYQPCRAPGATISNSARDLAISLHGSIHAISPFEAEIWSYCDGRRSVPEIARELDGPTDAWTRSQRIYLRR